MLSILIDAMSDDEEVGCNGTKGSNPIATTMGVLFGTVIVMATCSLYYNLFFVKKSKSQIKKENDSNNTNTNLVWHHHELNKGFYQLEIFSFLDLK